MENYKLEINIDVNDISNGCYYYGDKKIRIYFKSINDYFDFLR